MQVEGKDKREWSSGLCGWCFNIDDCGFCCLATWCGCIAYGMNTALIEGHNGYSPCCLCEWPESCECQYCGDACCLYCFIDNSRQMSVNNTFRPTNPTELAIGAAIGCLNTCITAAFLGFIVKKQVVAVGKAQNIYEPHLPVVCCGCDEPCCLSFWCIPCVLTMVHHEVLNDKEWKKLTYKFGEFDQVNSMFDSVKIR